MFTKPTLGVVAMPNDLEPERLLHGVAAHVDLHAIARDRQEIKDQISRRPAREEIQRLALRCLAALMTALLLLR